jgi:uncharacterized protein (UPF0276 family)
MRRPPREDAVDSSTEVAMTGVKRNPARGAGPLPGRAGVGFKPEHFAAILAGPREVGFFEVHAETYMGDGGPPHRRLEAIRARYPLSLHGVGLSIGSPKPLDRNHLARLQSLIRRYQPAQFSEHLAWSSHDEGFLADLLPLPYDDETLAVVCLHIDETQETLATRMLLENPSTYVQFFDSAIAETEFLAEVVRRTGCGLLLDVNNVYVSATNHGFDPFAYLAAFPLHHVGEIHLAGSADATDDEGAPLLIDAHNSPAPAPVWALYEETVRRLGPTPTLIEWDNDVPQWPVLAAEARRAETAMTRAAARGALRHAV